MKKAAACILAILLLMRFAVCEEKAQYPQTLNFLQVLYSHGFLCTDSAADSDGDEEVQIALSSAKLGDLTFRVFFTQNNMMLIRVFNAAKYTCTAEEAYRVCNELNGTYLFVKFFADATDKSITIAADMTLQSEENCGQSCFDLLSNTVQVIEDAADKLLKLDPDAPESK